MQTYQLELEEIKIQVTQKRIKNLHLKICPPNALVKVSAPLRLTQNSIKSFITSRLSWIREKQIKILSQKRLPEKKYLNGEVHSFFGKDYELEILETNSKPFIILTTDKIKLHIRKNFTPSQRQKIISEWHRISLKKIIPNYIKKWEEKMNLRVNEFGIKKMKTRWGTCNIKAKRIWINLELAKKHETCLEYIVVHEMVHLLEKNHNKKFFAHMDNFMPDWRHWKKELKTML